MASAANQEQPAADRPSSSPEEQKSLEQQESIDARAESINVNVKDTIEINNTESLTEEVIQVQPEASQKEDKFSSSVTRSPSDVTEEEEKTEFTSSQITTKVFADSPQQDDNPNWWDVILDKIRSFLPESMNKSLSDWALTAIVSSLIVLILSVSVILLPSRASSDIPPESTEIISIPKQEIEITVDSPSEKEKDNTATPSDASKTVSIPEQEIEITTDSTSTEEKEAAENTANSSEVVSTPVEIETPETLVTPKKPESLKVKTTPPPQPVLTPEQNLLNAVREKVSKITSQYSDDLIVSGKADLLGSRLLIKVSDDWYTLNQSRQDNFANETLKRSQKFNFKKLEIQDVRNNVIARSPVVGNKMIILQRTN